jgi:O-antigen ligase
VTQTRAPRPSGSAARARDVAAVLVVVVFGVLPFPDEAFRAGGPVLVVALLPVLVLPSRRSRPLLALAVSVGCVVVVALAGTFAPSALLAVAITAFSAADRTRRPIAVVSVLSAALAVFLVAAVPLDGDLLASPSATSTTRPVDG